MLKRVVRASVERAISLLEANRVGRYVKDEFIASVMRRTHRAQYQDLEFTFAAPNTLNRFRSETFAVKEPETLEWISQIPIGSVLWDVGANVGLYSCFAAKARQCRVLAFEPSVFNLEMLARNIRLNAVTDRVTIVPLPLTSSLGVNTLNMTTTEWGGALSTFGADFGYDGRTLDKVFDVPTIGLSMVDAVRLLALPMPDYLKMDVDGAEHLILSGGAEVLAHVQSVIIEINDGFQEHAQQAYRCLEAAGLSLIERRRWEGITVPGFESIHNQIWSRRESRT